MKHCLSQKVKFCAVWFMCTQASFPASWVKSFFFVFFFLFFKKSTCMEIMLVMNSF